MKPLKDLGTGEVASPVDETRIKDKKMRRERERINFLNSSNITVVRLHVLYFVLFRCNIAVVIAMLTHDSQIGYSIDGSGPFEVNPTDVDPSIIFSNGMNVQQGFWSK